MNIFSSFSSVFISTYYNSVCISKDIKQFNLQLLFFPFHSFSLKSHRYITDKQYWTNKNPHIVSWSILNIALHFFVCRSPAPCDSTMWPCSIQLTSRTLKIKNILANKTAAPKKKFTEFIPPTNFLKRTPILVLRF